MNEERHPVGSLMFYCPPDSISATFEKRVTHGLMDRRTNGWTEGQTKPLIEMRGRI